MPWSQRIQHVVGMEKMYAGILKYKATLQKKIAQDLATLKEPKPYGLFISCMDSRVSPTRFLQCDIGDLFIIRNPGNVVRHSSCIQAHDNPPSEAAALDMVNVKFGIKNFIVCGHSDCRAMMGLLSLQEKHNDGQPLSHIHSWLLHNGQRTFDKLHYVLDNPTKPVKFCADIPQLTFHAYIDPALPVKDKMSQINTLQTIENITSYEPVLARLLAGEMTAHALWHDLSNADVLDFDAEHQRFVSIDDSYKVSTPIQ